ncbi:MAG TPA: helix-turn-helix transcriptional regulator [Chthoniobacterales bacterium]|nr:helix-turn-helix transcriptional regulator [Chthoniobacterales bacterium]
MVYLVFCAFYGREPMPPRTQTLLKELKTWCDQKHGRQVEVARYLKLPPQAINNWFGKRSEPTGEQVLAIQEFLRKQKHSK